MPVGNGRQKTDWTIRPLDARDEHQKQEGWRRNQKGLEPRVDPGRPRGGPFSCSNRTTAANKAETELKCRGRAAISALIKVIAWRNTRNLDHQHKNKINNYWISLGSRQTCALPCPVCRGQPEHKSERIDQ
ncbi:hypothetical protein [Silvimonas sp.]|uniref:hypothetical protein n=1 Tax=Silvimonas sp. TaxID=2650811 RepID=UPI00284FFFA9|nr:hypothetical protein [Silvimonas sp.]MDR3429354.1 hypothetical protein [Silvimonas sp.]